MRSECELETSASYLQVSVHACKLVHLSLFASPPLLDRLIVVVELVVGHVPEIGSGGVGPVVRGAREAGRGRPQHGMWWDKALVHVPHAGLAKLLVGREGGVAAGRGLEGRMDVQGLPGRAVAAGHQLKVKTTIQNVFPHSEEITCNKTS